MKIFVNEWLVIKIIDYPFNEANPGNFYKTKGRFLLDFKKPKGNFSKPPIHFDIIEVILSNAN